MQGQEWNPDMVQAFEQGFGVPGPNQQHWPPGPPWGWGGPPFGCGCPPHRPPCPPGPGWDWNWRPPLGAIRGPIIGVTDGSLALQGEVGEYLSGVLDYTTVSTANQTVIVAPLVLTPGDWDVEATWRTGFNIGGFKASLTPQPIGVTSGMLAEFGVGTGVADIGGLSSFTIQSPRCQASVAVPTLLAFTVDVNALAGSTDQNGVVGQAFFTTIVTARRMR
jgi:hypothetical protein